MSNITWQKGCIAVVIFFAPVIVGAYMGHNWPEWTGRDNRLGRFGFIGFILGLVGMMVWLKFGPNVGANENYTYPRQIYKEQYVDPEELDKQKKSFKLNNE
jgi:hypothetical protein